MTWTHQITGSNTWTHAITGSNTWTHLVTEGTAAVVAGKVRITKTGRKRRVTKQGHLRKTKN